MSTSKGYWNNRVLVLDDNRFIHDLFRRILTCPENQPAECIDWEESNDAECFASEIPDVYRVDSAYHKDVAIEMIRKARDTGRPYALIITDVYLQAGRNGIETVKQIRQTDPDAEILICTGDWDDPWMTELEQVDRGEEIEIILKPFRNFRLCQQVQSLTHKWNHVQSAQLL